MNCLIYLVHFHHDLNAATYFCIKCFDSLDCYQVLILYLKKKNPCLQCDCIFCTLPSWSGHICFGAYSSLGALPDGP